MKTIWKELRDTPAAFHQELRSFSVREERFQFALWRCASVVMAIGVATLLQLDDLVWAGFSGFMVMRTDIGVSFKRGAHRVLGTVLGALLGLVGAALSADYPIVMMAFIFVVAWLTFMHCFFSRYSYAWLFFFLTTSMVMAYGLTSPDDVFNFAETRVAEIVIGTGACLLIAAIRAGAQPARITCQSTSGHPFRAKFLFNEAWLTQHWILVGYATRVGIVVALQPLIASFANLNHDTNLTQQLTTTFVVMMTTSDNVYKSAHRVVHTRMAHRLAGCILGSAFGMLMLGLFEQNALVTPLVLTAGILIGSQIEHGEAKINYVGTQFALAFMTTYIQMGAPATSISLGLDRLVGIIFGAVSVYCILECWPVEWSLARYRARHGVHSQT
ncbi:FUSC family protein [Carnimonas nigrificans]|uniref:FUSC family protein n=1 Tax=Carnimonas nigrificans TaxID=64323 RepID=UPI00046E5642|nr:FUSC family protein [Carnimonas nigrificans]